MSGRCAKSETTGDEMRTRDADTIEAETVENPGNGTVENVGNGTVEDVRNGRVENEGSGRSRDGNTTARARI